MFSKKLVTLAGIALPVALIAGCGELIVAEDGGAGSCDGSPFTIAATASEDASTYTIDYTGPSDVSLVLSPGFYIDEPIDGVAEFSSMEDVPAGSSYFAATTSLEDADSASVLKFDTTDEGWTTSGSGATTTYSFEGSFSTLIGDWTELEPLAQTIFPHIVGVVCDDAFTTAVIVDDSPSVNGFIDDITIQAAAELVPSHVLLDPFEISSQEPFGDGFAGEARFAAGSASIFGDFVPGAVIEGAMFLDDPSIPNNSFMELWFQAISLEVGDGPPPFEIMFPDGVSLDGDFPFTIEPTSDNPAEAPEAGNYLLFLLVADNPNDPSAVRVVFMNTYYDPESGVTFLDPLGEPVNPGAPDLADTGVDASAIGIGAGALLAGGVALGAVAAVRRARTKN
ncbi:MAG: hypothetical protein F2574_04585 [Actinobacteria bacterium]|uniref:Unannotated protein n=1 Tax=freshwater metagenome TaxID=449393 RepID=A0A6J6G8X9_9ZZZZ|nr:hypothetical protein [Actinomycetota bacterium]